MDRSELGQESVEVKKGGGNKTRIQEGKTEIWGGEEITKHNI